MMTALNKRSFLRSLLRWAGAGLLIGVLSFILLELLLRIFLPQDAPMMWLRPDARYGHVMKKNFQQDFPFPDGAYLMEVETNSLGFRDRPLPAKDPALPRVLFLGDSFTFGHGLAVEQRFDRLTEAIMKQADMPIQAVNGGVSAWGTLQATRYMQDHFELLQPDVIVLTFCENDPHDDSYFLQHGVSFDRMRFPGKNFLRAHCHLFRFAQHQYLLFLKRRYLKEKSAETTKPVAAAEKTPQKTAQVAAPLGLAHSVPPEDWARTRAYITDLAKAFRAYNPKGRLLIQHTGPSWGKVRRELKPLEEQPGIAFINIAPAARALSPEQWHLPYDGHWSPIMHRISAAYLAQYLMDWMRVSD